MTGTKMLKKIPSGTSQCLFFFCDRRPERRSLENARIINFFITISAVTNYFQISNLFYIQRADADLECFSLTQTWRQLTSRFLVMIAVESRRMKNCDDHRKDHKATKSPLPEASALPRPSRQ